MITVHAEIPDQLYKVANGLVEAGWFRDEKEIFSEAIRRYLDTHRMELMEKFILEDVEWGIHGNE